MQPPPSERHDATGSPIYGSYKQIYVRETTPLWLGGANATVRAAAGCAGHAQVHHWETDPARSAALKAASAARVAAAGAALSSRSLPCKF